MDAASMDKINIFIQHISVSMCDTDYIFQKYMSLHCYKLPFMFIMIMINGIDMKMNIDYM